MSVAIDTLKNEFRDYVIPSLPASGPHEPDKTQIRFGLDLLKLELNAGTLDYRTYATVAAMNADTDEAAGTLAYVFANAGSPSNAQNGFYQWNGSAWVSAAWIMSQVATAAQPAINTAIANTTVRIGTNTAVGTDSLAAGAPGSSGTAIGTDAMRFNTGGNNTAVGHQALRANVGGADNVAIGAAADRARTAGNQNVTIGSGAALLRAGGSGCVIVGYSAMGGATGSGSDITVIGAGAMGVSSAAESTVIGRGALNQATGIRNTVIGAFAGTSITTGAGNTFVGYGAGNNAGQSASATNSTAIGTNAYTTRSFQVSLGGDDLEEVRAFTVAMMRGRPAFSTFFLADAGNRDATGPGCVGIGREALAQLTSGGNNVAIGARALEQAPTPGAVIAIGTDAARLGATLTDTVAIGMEALSKATGGVGGTALGHFALQNATDAGNNTGLGDSALRFTTTGNQNLAAGYVVADRNVTGSRNVFLGAGAATYLSGGDDNVIIGHQAKQGTPVAVGVAQPGGSSNVVIGKDAGLFHTGSNCTFVGRGAGFGAGQKLDASNSIAIGVGAVATRDDEIVIGSDTSTHVTLAGVEFTRAELIAVKALLAP